MDYANPSTLSTFLLVDLKIFFGPFFELRGFMYDISEKGEKQYKRVKYLILGLYIIIPLCMLFITTSVH